MFQVLFALLAIVVATVPVAVIYLLISNASLQRRVEAVEKEIARRRATVPGEAAEGPASGGPWKRPTVRPSPQTANLIGPSPEKLAATSDPGAQRAVVFEASKLRALVTWSIQNWFYVVSAISLALSGVFLVIYGMEQGLLPPAVRVLLSFAFGCALVVFGEFIRRRYGDHKDSHTAYLPSVFSGAGIVTLFGSVLSARLLYNFISPDLALIGMAAVGVLAVVLGWFYGPLLAAVGILGAMVSPFIIGGSSDDPSMLLVYFAIVAVVGLAIDMIRRWAWVSVLSLILGFGTGALLTIGSSEMVAPYFVIYCAALVIAAVAIPVRKLSPNHTGPLLSMSAFARSKDDQWPEFPTRLAGGAMIAASILITVTATYTARADLFWIAVVITAALVLSLLIWARNAPALIDLTVFPAAALIIVVAGGAPLWRPIATAAKLPEADMPLMVSIVVAIGALLSIAAAWHSLRGGASKLFVALGASLLAPLAAVAIEVFWRPTEAIGSYAWALHAMALAAVMAVTAERFAKVDGSDFRDRISFAVLSTLACIAFGMVIVFSEAALTSAIALTVAAAAWLDRKFNLPMMGLYILSGVSAIGYRLVVDPGISWAIEAPFTEMMFTHAGAVVAFAVSYLLVRSAKRPRSEILLESAIFSSAGVLLSLLLYRAIQGLSEQDPAANHWSMGIGATIWIILGTAQIRRTAIGGPLSSVRTVLGLGFLFIGAAGLLHILTSLNPLVNSHRNLVLGPSILNTLMVAYLLPAVALGIGARWTKGLPPYVQAGFIAGALLLAGVWLGLVIRHVWRGALGMEWPGIDEPELYSYTVALLLIGAGLFYQSLAKQNRILRLAGLIFIGLAAAKVFILDIQGLGGLIRVFSLLCLGLALAGLAWLNRWAAVRVDADNSNKMPK